MRTIIATFIFFASAITAAQAAPLKPMSATYTVVRDGKPIGDATYALVANPDGTWTLRSQTHGSAGMARLLGLESRIGTLQAGRDADLIALDGEPLELTTSVQWVLVDGTIYEKDN